jgi:hypothetical protein
MDDMTRKNRVRWLALASAGVAALAFAAGAGSHSLTYASAKIEVSGPSSFGATGSQLIHIFIAPTDDPTAKVVIYAPTGYTANLGAAPGTNIGTVTAKVAAADLGGATLPLGGSVQAAAATTSITFGGGQAVLSDLATQCTGTATHAAYWLLVLSAAGQTLQVPAYVDPAADTETAFASDKIQVCLPPPDVPSGTPGRAAFGAKLFDAAITLKNVFTNPSSGALHVWSAILTPYTPGAGTPNAPGTVEVRSAVLLPVTVSLKGKYDPKKKMALLSGVIVIGQQNPTGAQVILLSGTAPAKLKANGVSGKATSTGAFTASRKIATTTYFVAGISTSAIDVTQQLCGLAASQAPAGCINGNVGPLFAVSGVVKVTVPKKK